MAHQKNEVDRESETAATPDERRRHRGVTKKAQILSLFSEGVTDLEEIAAATDAKPSYVASVLQESGLLSGYFDLYTHTAHPMNVYSKYFAGRLGFKDEAAANQSVDVLEAAYREFGAARDRAGQHHALMTALTLFDRARWSRKKVEADHFKWWLVEKLADDDGGIGVGEGH